MSVFTDIQSALNQRLSIMSSLPTVAYENTDIEPVVDTTYLRTWLLPVPTQYPNIGKDSESWLKGIFQIDILCTKGDGWSTAWTLADRIIAHFPRGLLLTYGGKNIRIEKVYPGPGRTEDNRYKIIININYNTFV